MIVAVEGPDGAGKTTVARRIARAIEAETPRRVLLRAEPGGSSVFGEQLRLMNAHTAMPAALRQVMLAADHMALLHDMHSVAHPRNTVWVMDRWNPISAWCYARASGVSGRFLDDLQRLTEFEHHVVPALVLILDAPDEVLDKRLLDKQRDILESSMQYQYKVRQQYRALQRLHKGGLGGPVSGLTLVHHADSSDDGLVALAVESAVEMCP